MSDLKEKQELSRINQKKCKFYNCSSYVKPKCKIEGGRAIVEIPSQNLVEEKSELMDVKENRLKMPEVEQKDL